MPLAAFVPRTWGGSNPNAWKERRSPPSLPLIASLENLCFFDLEFVVWFAIFGLIETLISNKVNDSLEVASLGFIVAAFLWSKECVGKIPEPRGSKGPKDIFFWVLSGLGASPVCWSACVGGGTVILPCSVVSTMLLHVQHPAASCRSTQWWVKLGYPKRWMLMLVSKDIKSGPQGLIPNLQFLTHTQILDRSNWSNSVFLWVCIAIIFHLFEVLVFWFLRRRSTCMMSLGRKPQELWRQCVSIHAISLFYLMYACIYIDIQITTRHEPNMMYITYILYIYTHIHNVCVAYYMQM